MRQASADRANPLSETGTAIRLEIQSSRWWALFTFKLTKLIFPDYMTVDGASIHAVRVRFWLTPWMRDENHMQISHISEVEHERGLIWDSITVESTGGLTPMNVRGFPKGSARRFVEHVRGLMKR